MDPEFHKIKFSLILMQIGVSYYTKKIYYIRILEYSIIIK